MTDETHMRPQSVVPFLELKPTYVELKQEMDAAWFRVMESGWYLLWKELEAFETEFAAYCGAGTASESATVWTRFT